MQRQKGAQEHPEPPSPVRGVPVRVIRLSGELQLRVQAERRNDRLVVDCRLFRRGILEHAPEDFSGTAAGWNLSAQQAAHAADAIREIAARLVQVEAFAPAAGHTYQPSDARADG